MINPLKVPCAYCKDRYPESMQKHYPDAKNPMSCSGCGLLVDGDRWVESGINAIAGELSRQGVIFSSFRDKDIIFWSWMPTPKINNPYKISQKFSSFEESVIDAWEALSRHNPK